MFTKDGKKIVVRGNANNKELGQITVYDADTYTSLFVLGEVGPEPHVLAVSSDDRFLASGTTDGIIRIWDLQSGVIKTTIPAYPECVSGLAWCQDMENFTGEYLASTCADLKHVYGVQLWNPLSGEEVRRWIPGDLPIRSIAFSPDGRWMLAERNDHQTFVMGITRDRLQPIGSGSVCALTNANFSPDSKHVALGGLDCAVEIWDIKTGEKVQKFTESVLYPIHVGFSPDGKLLLGSSAMGPIYVWDIASGTRLHFFKVWPALVHSVSWHPDSKRIIVELDKEKHASFSIFDVETGAVVHAN